MAAPAGQALLWWALLAAQPLAAHKCHGGGEDGYSSTCSGRSSADAAVSTEWAASALQTRAHLKDGYRYEEDGADKARSASPALDPVAAAAPVSTDSASGFGPALLLPGIQVANEALGFIEPDTVAMLRAHSALIAAVFAGVAATLVFPLLIAATWRHAADACERSQESLQADWALAFNMCGDSKTHPEVKAGIEPEVEPEDVPEPEASESTSSGSQSSSESS